MPAENLTLYARWLVDPHTITLNLNGGTGIESIYDDFGTELDTPEVEREGYTFIGWYSDEALSIPYAFTTMPAEDITVYAKWEINQYTISFEVNGGSAVDDIVQDYATIVTEPTVPIREYYIFDGWYLDESLQTPYVFTTIPAEDFTLYAKWKGVQYTVDNGTVIIDDYDGESPDVYIPLVIDGISNIIISANAFYDNDLIETINFISNDATHAPSFAPSFFNRPFVLNETNVNLNNTITIEDYAFYGMDNLVRITGLENVVSIGAYAFADSVNLEFINSENSNEYNFGDGLQTIGEHAFDNTPVVAFIGGSTTIQNIYQYAFTNTNLLRFNSEIEGEFIFSNTLEFIGFNAFDNTISIQKLIIPFIGESITTNQFLGYIFGALSYQQNTTFVPSTLNKISLLDTENNLGEGALYNLSQITTLDLGSNLTSIGEYAIYNLGISDLVIPNTVESISSYGVSEMNSLTTLNFENDSIISILGDFGFANLSSINELNLPSSLVYVGKSSLNGMSSLQSLSVPFVGITETTTIESEQMFGTIFGGEFTSSYSVNQNGHLNYLPNSFNEIVIEGGIIKKYSLSNITTLQSVSILDGVKKIEGFAFHNSNLITSMTLPFIGESREATYYQAVFGYIFGYETQISSTYSSGYSSIYYNVKYGSVDGATWQYTDKNYYLYTSFYQYQSYYYYIPSGLTEINVTDQTSIPVAGFNNMSNITTLRLPDIVTSIGAYAFQGMSSLATINSDTVGTYNIPIGVTAINENTFYENALLTDMVLEGEVTSIGANAFYGSGLETISLQNATSIGNNAFESVTTLTSIDLPNATSIGSNAFNGATGLTVVTMPVAETIGVYAFSGAINLQRINSEVNGEFIIPDSVTSIGAGAFKDVNLVTSITLPFIGESREATYYQAVFGYIFGYETQISSTYSSGYSSIYYNVKYGSVDGATWQYTDKNYYLYTSFYQYQSYYYYIPSGLTEINVTDQTSIPVAGFNNMSNITTLRLPDIVTSIGAYAFQGMSSLATINSDTVGTYNIPIGVTAINENTALPHKLFQNRIET